MSSCCCHRNQFRIIIVGGLESLGGPATKLSIPKVVSVIVAVIQLMVGGACIGGALGRGNQGQVVSTTAYLRRAADSRRAFDPGVGDRASAARRLQLTPSVSWSFT